jgi:hypothetical protein
MSNHDETQPAFDVQGLVRDIQNTVWRILESHGVDVPNKERWTAMYQYIPARPKKKEAEDQ